ncbi:aminodeoxychorismate lyase [Vibrio sp. SCSIO 43135]|uniref:aminodeoxychorismate lyase n=1 Tax=Vibrio sp. SCSIO 43135 TaxID=2819096 RepID=UPI00207555B8|nr:aminodeoxychorismate lyase [Vibrio sp. SCSIO 43135]USD41976.1 aminodeoxychorismate lyase [Vibrio sp. SCSIO 43135]
MFWLNGIESEHISPTDRSFQYGDGCFTTMLVKERVIEHWPLHLRRMKKALAVLDIQEPDWEQVQQWLAMAMRPESTSGLKLHISRGEGGRGYSPAQVSSPNVTISDFAFPSNYEQLARDGLALGVCNQRLGINPMLAGLKHNNRLEQVLLKAESEQLGYTDSVVLDVTGNVIETTMANLFWSDGSTLFTPSLLNSGVAGVMRQVVIDQAKAAGLVVADEDYDLDALLSAKEVFMTNSILGIAPVVQVADHHYSIGTLTRRLQENLGS